MWAKSLLLSAFAAVSAFSAPLDAGQGVRFGQTGSVTLIQDRQQNIRSLREVADEIRSQYGGELISARLEDGARPFYVLRWRMPSGEVRDFRVSAAR